MAYLLDTNVFLEAKNKHYGFDFCPAFWDWLASENRNGTVFSVEQVRDEILRRADVVAEWATARGDGLFLSSTPESSAAYGQIIRWARERDYRRTAVDQFESVADSYLIAHAAATGRVIVTHEISSNSRNKVKIPNVCAGLGIECLTPFEMLRREGARFVLGAPA